MTNFSFEELRDDVLGTNSVWIGCIVDCLKNFVPNNLFYLKIMEKTLISHLCDRMVWQPWFSINEPLQRLLPVDSWKFFNNLNVLVSFKAAASVSFNKKSSTWRHAATHPEKVNPCIKYWNASRKNVNIFLDWICIHVERTSPQSSLATLSTCFLLLFLLSIEWRISSTARWNQERSSESS